MIYRTVRSLILAGLFLVPVLVRGLYAQDAAFLSGIEDMPLPPGLYENLDTTLVFDSPEGRYVEAYAEGQITPLTVAEFYRHSLPQLGWQPDGLTSFRRDGEILVIVPTAMSDDWTSVRFALSPRETDDAGNQVPGP